MQSEAFLGVWFRSYLMHCLIVARFSTCRLFSFVVLVCTFLISVTESASGDWPSHNKRPNTNAFMWKHDAKTLELWMSWGISENWRQMCQIKQEVNLSVVGQRGGWQHFKTRVWFKQSSILVKLYVCIEKHLWWTIWGVSVVVNCLLGGCNHKEITWG